MVRGHTTLALAAAAWALAAGPAAAQSGLQPAFTYGGKGCVEPGVTVSVPVDRARAAVPEPFVPRSLSGDASSADVVLVVARCQTLDLNGRTVEGRTVVDAGVVIHSPDFSEGAHVYQLWHLSDARDISAAMAGVGVRGGHVADLAVEDAGPGALERATARVPWATSPYELSAEGAVSGSSFATTTWWHRGPRGVVRLGYSFPRSSVQSGTGRLSAQAGSPLASLVGGTLVDGAGSIARLDFAGRVSSEQPPAAPSSPSAPSSDTPGPAAPGSAPPRGRALRLVVRPSRVRAGRRVRVLARVTRSGEPVRRVLVKLGGRRARTDARGRARLTVRLRAGRHTATASHRSARTGRARVAAVR